MGKTCKIWTGQVNDDGYGRVKYKGRKVYVHRLEFYLHHGYWPPVVRHTCDNPPCHEITHLVEGTHQQNMDDMVAKGRQATGERNGRAKLTEAQVIEIRAMYEAGGVSHRQIAVALGVDHSTVGRILRHKHWKAA